MSTCDVCQRRNNKMVINCDELHPVLVHSLWHHVAIDFIGPVPISSSGNRFVWYHYTYLYSEIYVHV